MGCVFADKHLGSLAKAVHFVLWKMSRNQKPIEEMDPESVLEDRCQCGEETSLGTKDARLATWLMQNLRWTLQVQA